MSYKSYDEGDEDLAALARAAGYFPEEKNDAPADNALMPQGGYAYEGPDTSPYEQRQPTNVFAANVDPSFNPGSVAPVGTTTYGQGMGVSGLPAVATPLGTSHSTGASSSYRGFGENKFGQVQKATNDPLARGNAEADATANAMGAREFDPLNKAYASNVDAAKAQAQAQIGMIQGQGEGALVMQRLNDEFAAEEAKINAQATAQSNQAKADYLTALNDFRAAKVDPSQLWHNMTGGERFGTLASAFVHDFLGVKGINTSAMATLNKAIDRNIDAQVQAIRTKGEAAEGFKSLWYMQRNQSASDTEARARVRGFLLDGAKQAVLANMTQYESALASAQGKSAIAKIDEELAKSYIDVYRHIDNNALALRQQALSKWQTQVNAALESQANSIRQQEANTHAKQVKDPVMRGIYDPESKQLVAYYKPGITEKEMQDTDASLKNSAVANKDISDLRQIARALGENSTIDPITKTRFAGTPQQMYDSLAQRLAHSIIATWGERPTDKDVEDILAGLRTPSWFNGANADKVLAFTQDKLLGNARASVSQYGFVPKRDEAGNLLIENAPDDLIFRGATADAVGTYAPPPESPDQIRRKNAGMELGQAAGREKLDEESTTFPVKQLHNALAAERPDLFGGSGSHRVIAPDGTIKEVPGGESKPIYRFEHGLAEYADMASKGDKEALAHLQRIAAGYVLNHDDPEAAMAAWIISNGDLLNTPKESFGSQEDK